MQKRTKTARVRIGAIIIGGVLLVSGCGFDVAAVYDNESRIASTSNSYSRVNYEQTTEREVTKLECDSFEGMDTIWDETVEEETERRLFFDLEVGSGKAKLVLITSDGDVETLVEVTAEEGTGEGEDIPLKLEKGRNRIKLVGAEDTAIKLSMAVLEP